MTDILNEISSYCTKKHIPAPTYFILPEPIGKMTHGISIVCPLSKAIIEEVADVKYPTHSYFHHYRTVNFFLDQCMLEIGLTIQDGGYEYMAVGASQSIPTPDSPKGFHGRFSHKQGACLGGGGYIGSSGLFLHKDHGPRVRLGTILTNMPAVATNPPPAINTTCNGCFICVKSCPGKALKGKIYTTGMEDFSLVDPEKCSQHMKSTYKMIGRGAVCGVCMAVCPVGK